jgi:hypothetical protein
LQITHRCIEMAGGDYGTVLANATDVIAFYC